MIVELREYQQEISKRGAETLIRYGIVYLCMECRTGKTLTALNIASECGAKRVLVITKLKAITSIMEDYNMLQPPYTLDIVNYESAHKNKNVYDIVILDEAHTLGSYPRPSKRSIEVKRLCASARVIYLSGTPTPESYSQLFHQFWVSSRSPWAKYPTFYKWARSGYVNVTQRRINGFVINDYSDADKIKIDNDTAHLFISYTQEQAGFKNELNEFVLTVPMRGQTKQMLKELKRNRVVEMGDNVILGQSPASLLTKMHQLSSGTVICENGALFTLDNSKAEYIKAHFANQKLAIFYVYRQEAEALKRVFPDWTDSPEEFQAKSDKVFISQVRRAREGVRLDTADALIFYNLEYSYLSYEQGRNRLVSKERAKPTNIYFLCSDCGIEADILDAVHNKQDFTLSYYQHKERERT